MTKDNAKQFLPFVQALVEGKTIQFNSGSSDKPYWYDMDSFKFDFDAWRYRIKPETKRVPLTADDIPAVCWVRFRDGSCSGDHLVVWIGDNTVYLNANSHTFTDLMTGDWFYSSDRKTWLPCYKEI